MWETVGALVATGVGVIGAVGVGYTVGKGHMEPYTSYLKDKVASLEKENQDLKLELQSATKFNINSSENSGGPTQTRSDEENGEQTVDIKVGDTHRLLNDELFISLRASEYLGSPLTHKVSGVITTKSGAKESFDKLEAGDVISIEKFTLRVLNTGSFRAEFMYSTN